jgi:hypothetical protein
MVGRSIKNALGHDREELGRVNFLYVFFTQNKKLKTWSGGASRTPWAMTAKNLAVSPSDRPPTLSSGGRDVRQTLIPGGKKRGKKQN